VYKKDFTAPKSPNLSLFKIKISATAFRILSGEYIRTIKYGS